MYPWMYIHGNIFLNEILFFFVKTYKSMENLQKRADSSPRFPMYVPAGAFIFSKSASKKNRSRKKTEIDKTAVYRTYNRAYNRKYNRTDSSQGLRVYVPAGAFIFSKSASKKKSTSGKIEIGKNVEYWNI